MHARERDDETHHQRSPSDLAATLAAAQSDSGSQRLIGKRIGRYRIISLVGEGGMGAVYLAEQDHPKRQVALKLIRPGGSTLQLIKRFALEAEALGRLQHPGIAQIHDAGVHDEGEGAQPYFAMEYIRGEPLDVFVRQRALGTRVRLELAARICDAVQHAHQKGLIHRDLKPGNILVTEDGQPKILDFGVARATDSDIKTTTLNTDVGQLIGTVPYMSPEQVTGDPSDLDTRSDVYALGVMIYEMLAGKLPYEIERKMIHEAVRVIREQEPTRLSNVDRVFRGDVETIVSKALEKDKTRRYQAASALAADIRRYLNDEAISAQAPSHWYQAKKFAKRNKAIVIGTAIVLLVSLVGAGIATWQAIVATKAQYRALENENSARLQAAKAEQTSSFIRAMLEGIEPATARGRDTTLLRIILDQTSARADKELADQPEVEASIRYTIGKALNKIAQYDRADAELSRAAQLQVATLGENDRQTLLTRQAQAMVLANRGKHVEAETLFRRTYGRQLELLGADHRESLDTAQELGIAISRQGRQVEAEQLLRQTLARRERVNGIDDSPTIGCRGSLAVALYMQSQLPEAEKLLREALEQRLRVSGPDHTGVFALQSNLASVLQSQDKHDDAEQLNLASLDGMIRVYGPEHPETLKQRNNVANFYDGIGRLEDAERIHREVLEVRSRTLGAEHAETLFSMNNLGNVLRHAGRLDEAEQLIRQALEGRKRTLGTEHYDTLSSMSSLALVLDGQRKFREVADMYGLIARSMALVKSEKDPDLGLYFYNWAASLQNCGAQTDAEPAYREVLRLHETSGGDDRPYMAAALNGMAKCLLAQKKYDESNEYFQKGLDMRRRMFKGASTETVYSLHDYGHGLMKQDRHGEAEPLLREALSMVESAAPDNVIRQTQSRCILGECLSAMGQFAESETLLLRAHKDMFDGGPGASRPDVQKEVLDNLVRLYERWSEAPDGAAHATDLQRWREELERSKDATSSESQDAPTNSPT